MWHSLGYSLCEGPRKSILLPLSSCPAALRYSRELKMELGTKARLQLNSWLWLICYKTQTWIKNLCLQKQQRPDRRETATYKYNDSCTETSLLPQLRVCTIPTQLLKSLLRPLLTPAVNCNPLSVQLHHRDQLMDCSANSVTLTAVSFTALGNRWL